MPCHTTLARLLVEADFLPSSLSNVVVVVSGLPLLRPAAVDAVVVAAPARSMPLFKSLNKSQASLERIANVRDSGSPIHRNLNPHNPETAHYGGAYAAQQQQPPPPQPAPSASAASPQQLQQTAPHPLQQQPAASQHLDERYYAESQSQSQSQSQQPSHPAHVLSRSTSNRVSSASGDPYAAQRPPATAVPPTQSHETIHEDPQLVPGQTVFGQSQKLHKPAEKEHKKSKRSIFGLGSSKDKKEGHDSSDRSRLNRQSSVLKRGTAQQQAQYSPTASSAPQQQQQQQQQHSPSSASTQGASASISAYLEQSHANNAGDTYPGQQIVDDTAVDNPDHYEQYYQQNRPSVQYEAGQEQAYRQSVQYVEDAPHFTQPPHAQQQQQQQQQQHKLPPLQLLHLQQQQQLQDQQSSPEQQEYQFPRPEEQGDQSKTHFFPYPGQPIRQERPLASAFEVDASLRPPSQTSLGPPSPVAADTAIGSRPGTAVGPSRFSAGSINTQQLQPQPVQQSSEEESSAHSQTPLSAEMGRGDRERQQRESRMDEQDQRYQDPRVRMSQHPETGRNTPPPPRTREDITQLDHQQLLMKYEELTAKYSKVKRYYFERENQITQLQNTVATQRLSMSKTSLDDAQYGIRFERLNSAVQNLAFNIRKDWRRIPNWLAPACNREACQVGTKEMTAIGRACISRWLFERIFNEIFHPGIDPILSSHLKNMERNIRHTSTMLTEEQREDLLTKVTTWRLTTCEGLQDVLNSRQCEHYMDELSRNLAHHLSAHLRYYMNDPPPAGLDEQILTIIGQSLFISSNLPLESRDISITYFFPGTPISDVYMKIEPGMTPLTNPGSAPSMEDPYPGEDEADEERMSTASEQDNGMGVNVEDQIREASAKAAAAASQSQQSNVTMSHKLQKPEKKSGGMFGGFGGSFTKKPTPARSQSSQNVNESIAGKPTDNTGKDDQQPPVGQQNAWNIDAMTRGSRDGKIRLSVFLAVEIRGKIEKKNHDQQSSNNTQGGQQSLSANGSAGGDGQQSLGQQSKQSGQASGGSGGVGSSSGTSGSAGLGGVNVLVRAPVYTF